MAYVTSSKLLLHCRRHNENAQERVKEKIKKLCGMNAYWLVQMSARWSTCAALFKL